MKSVFVVWSKTRRVNFLAVVMISLLLVCGGCATGWLLSKKAELILPEGNEDENGAVSWPDESLKERYASYWGLRYEGVGEKLWEFEAPYFRELVNRKKYVKWVSVASNISLDWIELKKVEPKSKYLYEVHGVLRLRQSESRNREVYIVDEWVKVEDAWFHIIRDRFVFPEAL